MYCGQAARAPSLQATPRFNEYLVGVAISADRDGIARVAGQDNAVGE